jgi:Nitrile hydratase, alpha chain
MSQSTTTIAQVAAVVDRAASDSSFRAQLLSAPAATLQSAGVAIPSGAEVKVLENTGALVDLVLPPKPAVTSPVPAGLDAYSQLVADTWNDPALEAKLLQNPAAVLSERGLAVPAGVQVRVTAATEQVLYLVVPPAQGGTK